MSSQSISKSSTSPATRILVAEDETLIRMDLVEMLTEAGYEVIAQATNGEEAIALAITS
jgi:response regulator NasT